MYGCYSIQNSVDDILKDINNTIELIYITPCVLTRNILLYQLKNQIHRISILIKYPSDHEKMTYTTFEPQLMQQDQRIFTLKELSKYDGKNGNPAYVAINGIIYDVTNNAAWAAGSHFGLVAGKDLTSEFASCHVGQNILDKLIVVGKLET